MILVFGGTTEGKQVIEVLNTLQKPFVYSTKTKINVDLGKYGVYKHGALSVKELELFIEEKEIETIVHAAHPFAEELHKTIAKVSRNKKLPVYRVEREYLERIDHFLVNYVNNYKELIDGLLDLKIKESSLFLTGVQTIAKLKNYWKNHRSYFRILNRESSMQMALKEQFDKEQLILGMPNKTIAQEVSLYKSIQAGLVVTKESGTSGQLYTKIQAAIDCNIPIWILKKPTLPNSFVIVKNKEELIDGLSKSNSLKIK